MEGDARWKSNEEREKTKCEVFGGKVRRGNGYKFLQIGREGNKSRDRLALSSDTLEGVEGIHECWSGCGFRVSDKG